MRLLFYIVDNANMRSDYGTVGVLYCWKSRRKGKSYSWRFILFKIQKEDLAGYLFHWKDQNKGRLEIFLTKKAKMRYSFVPNCTGGSQIKCSRWKIIKIFKIGAVFLVHSLIIVNELECFLPKFAIWIYSIKKIKIR